MAISPAVSESTCCADAVVPRVSKPVPMVTAPAAASPVFRKLRRFRGVLITFPSFFIFVLLHKDLQVRGCASCRTFSEHAFKSERLFRVDPHTGIAAKLLDEGINLYQGIAWRLGSLFRGSLLKRIG